MIWNDLRSRVVLLNIFKQPIVLVRITKVSLLRLAFELKKMDFRDWVIPLVIATDK